MRFKTEMSSRVLLPEEKYMFNKRWSDLWDLHGKYKKLFFREVTAARKYDKRNRNRETSGGQLSRQLHRVHEATNTEVYHIVILRTPLSSSGSRHKRRWM